MGLSKISIEKLDSEKESLYKLYQCIDVYDSVIFNSGAGSGKTYALIECLKYIISYNRENLKNHNQKIACITYTNVAAKHIEQQLGNSDVIEISTIHERIWRIISTQKSALLKLHIEKLKNEIADINNQLLNNPDYAKYQELEVASQEEFFRIMVERKNDYNRAYNLKAADFKAAKPEEVHSQYVGLISSVSKFKGLVDKLYKRKRYLECLHKIYIGDKNYKIVSYDAMFNRDRLDKMRISHDTLLEYGYALVEKYPRMKQLFIDNYPYILIDEYQDTADIVVKMMNIIDQYAKQIKHNIFIAYFGDSVQNIYEAGVGNRIKQLHSDLSTVTKLYNRRSYAEIINVANNIRSDEIIQKSIYSDSEGGSVKLYYGVEQDVKRFINVCAEKWNVQIENPLHCLFATNQMVAEYSGFFNLYMAFKNAEVYQGIGYKQLNSELLSHDIIHLGIAQTLLYRLMKLYTEVRKEKQPLRDIFPNSEYRNMSYASLKSLLTQLQSLDGNTLDELLVQIFKLYNTSNNKIYQLIIERMFDVDEDTSYDGTLKYLLTSLYKSWDETVEVKTIINAFLNIKVDELLNWFHYINRDEKKRICYHTFHSTKGLEYENVVIILGKDFGMDKGVFDTFFKFYGKNNEKISSKEDKGRNILYVAVTRAIKNLCILYIDNLGEIQDNIERVFGKSYQFSDDISSYNL
jgi:DNA helicase II / ATP-dependent DNA helicase PcrA